MWYQSQTMACESGMAAACSFPGPHLAFRELNCQAIHNYTHTLIYIQLHNYRVFVFISAVLALRKTMWNLCLRTVHIMECRYSLNPSEVTWSVVTVLVVAFRTDCWVTFPTKWWPIEPFYPLKCHMNHLNVSCTFNMSHLTLFCTACVTWHTREHYCN